MGEHESRYTPLSDVPPGNPSNGDPPLCFSKLQDYINQCVPVGRTRFFEGGRTVSGGYNGKWMLTNNDRIGLLLEYHFVPPVSRDIKDTYLHSIMYIITVKTAHFIMNNGLHVDVSLHDDGQHIVFAVDRWTAFSYVIV